MRVFLVALLLVAAAGCRRNTEVGALSCVASSDCGPPDSVCGADGRCVAGCVQDVDLCMGAAVCDPGTGECSGAMPCSDDTMCDPPAAVCRASSKTCVAGCTLSPCAIGFVCNAATGRCCDPSAPGCSRPPDQGAMCNTDPECAGWPSNICSAGMCVPGCAQSGCTDPFHCNPNTGHCETTNCARDLDCDPGSYCTPSATCAVLAFGGPILCATGGTNVSYRCAQATSSASFASCAGAPGPNGCPYCIDKSCFHAGVCQGANDCHRGDACLGAMGGLCVVQSPQCPPGATVAIADVAAGKYAAGKEVCVRDQVTAMRQGYDGMIELRLSSSPFLYVDIPPMYAASENVRIPGLGEVVTVHGTVRWDAAHNDRELLPVDWVSP